MAKKNWLSYANDSNRKLIEARQMGGEAPAPGGAPEQGGTPEQGPNPQQLLEAWGQAMQAKDEATAKDIAQQFTAVIYTQMANEQQATQGAMAARNGAFAPSFDKEGNLINS